jgi:hypothetical protein
MKERPMLFSAPMVRAILEGRKTQTRRISKDQPNFAFGVKQIVRVPDPWHDEAFAGTPAEGMGTKGKRQIQWHCEDYAGNLVCAIDIRCPYGVPGDRLWVKETWAWSGTDKQITPSDPWYRATHYKGEDFGIRWRPSIHMPRWASRITLEVVSVRVERLSEISEADAKAEGIYSKCIHVPPPIHIETRYVSPGVKMVNAADEVDYEAPAHRTAKQAFECLWESINGYGSWSENPWVWVVEFKRLEQA